MKLVDLTGKQIGRLTITGRAPNNGRKTAWYYRCSCGTTGTVNAGDLAAGRIVSCGCYNKEVSRKHGMSRTRLYSTYHGMLQRCHNPQNKAFRHYGGRGIEVCEEWRESFEAFRDWALANGYRDDLTLDRKDNNKGYSSENCRWATYMEQLNNTRKNIYVSACGKTLTYAQWGRFLGVSCQQIAKGVKKHGSVYIERLCAERNTALGLGAE